MNEDSMRRIQNYGEQHPLFHSKEMKAYRKADKSKAKQNALNKKKGDIPKEGGEYRGNLKITHKGNTHTYEPSDEQKKINQKLYEEKRKKFGSSY